MANVFVEAGSVDYSEFQSYLDSRYKFRKVSLVLYRYMNLCFLFFKEGGTFFFFRRETGQVDTITFQNITVTKTGKIGARMDFRIQGHCTTDYSRYPTDKIMCCFDMKSTLYSKIIEYNIISSNGVINFDQAVTRWNVLDFKIKNEMNDDGSSRISICLNVTRQSTTLRIELMLPMAICAILLVVSPLFGSMMHQIYVKMFSLLLQFLCFQFLVNRTPAAGFGDTVPKICTRFFTVCSFLLFMLIANLKITYFFR